MMILHRAEIVVQDLQEKQCVVVRSFDCTQCTDHDGQYACTKNILAIL